VPVLGDQKFSFYASYTPYIYGVVPHGIAPGDNVTLLGDFQWAKLDMYNNEPQDPRGYIREVRIGEFLYVLSTALVVHTLKLLTYIYYGPSCKVNWYTKGSTCRLLL
jgi:hypothetical protein